MCLHTVLYVFYVRKYICIHTAVRTYVNRILNVKIEFRVFVDRNLLYDIVHLCRDCDLHPLAGWYGVHLLLCIVCDAFERSAASWSTVVPEESE